MPRIGLALGGGGARGLAHIAVLEAFDALGLKPSVIAGSSMGAIVAAGYAAGLTGRQLRDHALDCLTDRTQVLARLLQARVGRLSHLVRRRLGNPMLVDAETFLDLFWPEAVPERFEDLALPLVVAATDYYSRREVLIEKGRLVSAVGASMAIPGLVRPVTREGHVLIDGGAVDPLPFEPLFDRADVVIAVDVTGGPAVGGGRVPDAFDALLGAMQIMQHTIVAAKLAARPPHILVRPAVDPYRGLDFFKAGAILAAAEPAKDELKRKLETLLARGERGARRTRRQVM